MCTTFAEAAGTKLYRSIDKGFRYEETRGHGVIEGGPTNEADFTAVVAAGMGAGEVVLVEVPLRYGDRWWHTVYTYVFFNL